MKRRTQSVDASRAGRALSAFVAELLEIPPEQASRLVQAGAVYVDGKRRRSPESLLQAGQTILAVLEESGRSTLAPSALPPLEVLFEDAWLLAVNKASGVATQPTPGRVGESLLDSVMARVGKGAGLVHRLDRDTSGVVVFAKKAPALTALTEQFRVGAAKKRYLAACGPNLVESGEIDLPISKDPSRPGRYRASKKAHGKPARTTFRRLYAHSEFCLVELFPHTGRTHQLRAHLAAVDAPILGDAIYGGAAKAAALPAPRCLLHARTLRLVHPQAGTPLVLEAPVPGDLSAFFELAQIPPPGGTW